MKRDELPGIGASTGGIIYDALLLAQQAKQEVLAHEDVCAQRYLNIQNELTGIKDSIRNLWKIIAWAGSTTMLIVMGLLSFLLKIQFENSQALQTATAQRLEINERTDAIERHQAMPPRVIIQRGPSGSPEIGATIEPASPTP